MGRRSYLDDSADRLSLSNPISVDCRRSPDLCLAPLPFELRVHRLDVADAMGAEFADALGMGEDLVEGAHHRSRIAADRGGYLDDGLDGFLSVLDAGLRALDGLP